MESHSNPDIKMRPNHCSGAEGKRQERGNNEDRKSVGCGNTLESGLEINI